MLRFLSPRNFIAISIWALQVQHSQISLTSVLSFFGLHPPLQADAYCGSKLLPQQEPQQKSLL
ncbi:MAG: hypothetical protein RSB44_06310, partial [Carnobacterium sp.]